MISFAKYHGAGNDFIMIDNRSGEFKDDKVAFAQKWCERRFGIGSDGVIFLEEDHSLDFFMDFYNPDGSQSFCGNGSRCVVAFAKELGIIENETVFRAFDGMHRGEITSSGIKIEMNDVMGVELKGEDIFIYTGSPHYISYCGPSDNRNIVDFGKSIRYSKEYEEEGTNVNLIKEISTNHIEIRTYERGVEDETYACGTGATACGLAYAHKYDIDTGIIDVNVKGGKLKIHFNKKEDTFSDVWLEGPAEFVFKGEING